MFEFDEEKNAINKEKHGVSFKDAQKLWDVDHIIIPAKNIEDEDRYLILGRLNQKIYAAVFTLREDNIRLISCHRADKKLEGYYYENIK